MPKQIVIIGAVALGPKAACRIRRLDPTTQVTLIEQNRHFDPEEAVVIQMEEIPNDKPIILVCNSGVRSYEAQILLDQEGITQTHNLAGGVAALKWAGLNPLEEVEKE